MKLGDLTNNIEKYKIKTSKHKYEFQALAEEIGNYFNVNAFPVFYKYDKFFIKKAFEQCKEKKLPYQYFMGLLYGYTITPDTLKEKLRELYKKENLLNFKDLLRRYGWKLTKEDKEQIQKSIDTEYILRQMRKLYQEKRFIELKKLLDNKGWLLPKDKVKKIEDSIGEPDELLEFAYVCLNK